MASFQIETWLPPERGDLSVVRLDGSLDASSIERVEKALQGLPPERPLVLVNCRKLKFISSSGLGLFLETHGRLEGQGGKVIFTEVVQPEVHDAMNLLGFFDVFDTAESEAEGLKKGKH